MTYFRPFKFSRVILNVGGDDQLSAARCGCIYNIYVGKETDFCMLTVPGGETRGLFHKGGSVNRVKKKKLTLSQQTI